MIISIGSDHAGYELKEFLKTKLDMLGHDILDLGTNSAENCDYPDFAKKVSETIIEMSAEMGILICGTGIGMSISANRLSGIRAALCFNEYMAEKSRMHNDANILVLGARVISKDEASNILDKFMNSKFEGGRHAVRLAKIG